MLRAREGKISHPNKITPADRIMAEVGGDYLRLSEVAEYLGVSTKTMRRWIGKKGVKAPSYVIEHGGMTMYVYTPEDVKELREKMNRG